jgi:peroxiredoxin
MRPYAAALAVAALLAGAAPASAALAPGAAAPAFSAPGFQDGKPLTFDLVKALKKGPVVLYFFPAAFTAGCDIEAGMFAQAVPEFQAAGATVIGVTAGNLDRLAAFSQEKCSGKFPVAADPGAKLAKQYDAVLPAKPDWSHRTSYVIAPDGKIALAYTDLKPNEHVAKTLEAVKALKR